MRTCQGPPKLSETSSVRRATVAAAVYTWRMTTPDGLLPPLPGEPFDELLTRARAEFLEMPGLKLTAHQAEQLWALDGDACRRVLAALEEAHFLVKSSTNAYVRS